MKTLTRHKQFLRICTLIFFVAFLVHPVPSGAEGPAITKKVDLNNASVQELATLPGIGEAKAEAIVRKRSELGGFASVDDLLTVTGIGEKVLKKMDGLVFVGKVR